MPDVVLIRPGCTDYDDQHRIQGSLDLPLNQRGLTQVDVLVAELTGADLDAIYTDPCEPARSTAETLGDSLNVPVKEIDGLRNLDQGLWQGQTIEDVRRKYPKVYKQWCDSPESICPPEGEMVVDAMHRVRESLERPLKRKHTFAVVASEPLATLVRCIITGNRPEFAGESSANGEPPRFEWYHVNGAPPPAGAEHSNGSRRKEGRTA